MRPQRRRAGKHVQRSGVGRHAQLLEIRRVLVGRVAVVLLHVEGTGVRGPDLTWQVGLEEGLDPVGVGSGLGERVDDLSQLRHHRTESVAGPLCRLWRREDDTRWHLRRAKNASYDSVAFADQSSNDAE